MPKKLINFSGVFLFSYKVFLFCLLTSLSSSANDGLIIKLMNVWLLQSQATWFHAFIYESLREKLDSCGTMAGL